MVLFLFVGSACQSLPSSLHGAWSAALPPAIFRRVPPQWEPALPPDDRDVETRGMGGQQAEHRDAPSSESFP